MPTSRGTCYRTCPSQWAFRSHYTCELLPTLAFSLTGRSMPSHQKMKWCFVHCRNKFLQTPQIWGRLWPVYCTSMLYTWPKVCTAEMWSGHPERRVARWILSRSIHEVANMNHDQAYIDEFEFVNLKWWLQHNNNVKKGLESFNASPNTKFQVPKCTWARRVLLLLLRAWLISNATHTHAHTHKQAI